MNTIKNAFALVKNNWQYMPRWAKVADAILILILLIIGFLIGLMF